MTAVVTARSADEFDVVLELAPGALTLRIWGLELRHPLPREAGDAWDAAALAALDEWLALLDGSARVEVLTRGGAACCWTVTGHAAARGVAPRWHPAPPPLLVVRWLRRWRRNVRVNRLLDADAVAELRADARAAATASRAGSAADQGAPLAVA